MRKNMAEDEGIKGMLRDEYNRCLQLMEQIKQSISQYPRGQLIVKKVKVKGHVYKYHHLQWREGEKILSRHVPEKEIPELKEKIEQREAFRKNGRKLEKRLEYLAPLIGEKKPSKRSFGLKVNMSSTFGKKPPKDDEKSMGQSFSTREIKKG